MAIGAVLPGALAVLAAVALVAATAGTAQAQSYPVVCGDRLCSEVPGGYAAWVREWQPAAYRDAPAADDDDAGDDASAADDDDASAAAQADDDAGDDASAADDDAGDDASAADDDAGDDAAPADAATELGMPAPTTRQLADGVYMIDYMGYVSLVVVSGEDVMITDPANDLRSPVVRDEVAGITDSPVTLIVLTHEHFDHAGGTSLFGDADIVCQANCADVFALDPFGRVPDEVDVTFDKFLSLDVGNKTVELHSFGPADGEATTVIYLPDDMIVYTADLYTPRGFTDGRWMGDVSYPGVRNVLGTIAEWPMDHAVNGHSAETDPKYLRESADMVEALYDAVHAEMSGPVEDGDFFALLAVMETLPDTLELEEYAEWDGYEDHFPAHVHQMIMGMFHGD